ncbi:hypothetical protein KUTeg_021275 [Tegillarca granosa]|uniref:Uncharacterized protein n=1 Tax=Tegillarca granosa TaxID=220873 RepID=A0ABQ9EAC6_TEGGR|nr:hypothetical protein KUTeg_021275 [Tegillarca granosa]
MYANICTLFGFILATISVVDGGSYCIYTYTYLYYYNHYCSFGCCGYYTGVMPPGVVYPQAPHTTTVVTGYPNTAYQSPPYVQGIQPQPNTEGFQSQQLMPTSPPPYPGLENELQQK